VNMDVRDWIRKLNKRQKWISATILLIALAFAISWIYGPYSWTGEECWFCGRERHRTKRLGFTIKDEIRENEYSRWVDGIHPAHSVHTWRHISSQRKEGWFGYVLCADGWSNLYLIHKTRASRGEAVARDLLKEYHDLRESGDAKKLNAFMQRLQSEER
jgi:hypothetical protein